MLAKKNLELNPHHPVMKELLRRVKDGDGQVNDATKEYTDLLFQMALLNSGFQSEEPTDLTSPLEKLIRVGFGLDRDSEIEEIVIELEEDIVDDSEPVFEDDIDEEEEAPVVFSDDL